MTRFVLLFFAIVTLPSFALADIAIVKIPPEQQKILEDVSRFREVHSSTNLPSALVALCADGRGRFAEPGQAWNATDAIIDESLSRSRLIWAATDGDYYIVHFERGGISHTFEILISTMKPEEKKPTVILHAYTVVRLKDYRAFVRQMAAGLISND